MVRKSAKAKKEAPATPNVFAVSCLVTARLLMDRALAEAKKPDDVQARVYADEAREAVLQALRFYPIRATPGEYADYVNFSSMAPADALDGRVSSYPARFGKKRARGKRK